MKAGILSTEFYLTLIVEIVGALAVFGIFEPENCEASWCAWALKGLGLVVMVLGSMGYQSSRAKVKSSDG